MELWKKIIIAVVVLLLITVLIVTLVVVLRREEWVVLERTFVAEGNRCTPEWSSSGEKYRKRCMVPNICDYQKDDQWGYCVPPQGRGDGANCLASPYVCGVGYVCDPVYKLCRRVISVGDSCTEQNAFLCETGICGYASLYGADGNAVGSGAGGSRYCVVKDLPPLSSCDNFRHCVPGCLVCNAGRCQAMSSAQIAPFQRRLLSDTQTTTISRHVDEAYLVPHRSLSAEGLSTTLNTADVSKRPHNLDGNTTAGIAKFATPERNPNFAAEAAATNKLAEPLRGFDRRDTIGLGTDRIVASSTAPLTSDGHTHSAVFLPDRLRNDESPSKVDYSLISEISPSIDGNGSIDGRLQDDTGSSDSKHLHALGAERPAPESSTRDLESQGSSELQLNDLTTEEQEWLRGIQEAAASEVSRLLGDEVSVADLEKYFAAKAKEQYPDSGDNEIDGQQIAIAIPPIVNGGLTARLSKLFAGVSYALTPEEQHMLTTLPMYFTRPMISRPFSSPQPTYGPPFAYSDGPTRPLIPQGYQPIPTAPQGHPLYGMSSGEQVYENSAPKPSNSINAMAVDPLDSEASNTVQGRDGYPFEAFLMNEGRSDSNSAEGSGNQELEGLFYPGNPYSRFGMNRGPMSSFRPSAMGPQMMRPSVLPPPALLPVRGPVRPAALPPPPGSFVAPPTPPPLRPGIPPSPLLPNMIPPAPPSPSLPPFRPPAIPFPPGAPPLPIRPPQPLQSDGYCLIDKCCAETHYCPFHRSVDGCQLRKQEGAACHGDSPRECRDDLSCVNGECRPWFTSPQAISGDLIYITENVDTVTVCTPWQKFEYHINESSAARNPISDELLERPSPNGSTIFQEMSRTYKKIIGRCIALDGLPCVTDHDCWGAAPFGFCDMRSKHCRSPTYPSCLDELRSLYSCLDGSQTARDTTQQYIVATLPRMPGYIVMDVPPSILHIYSRCAPSDVQYRRTQLLRCVKRQSYLLHSIVA